MQSLAAYLGQLVDRCPGIDSIWTIGHRADGAEPLDPVGARGWDLVAFADKPTLRRLRGALDLHRADVRLRVVVDGDRFEPAWGGSPAAGSLRPWEWRQATRTEAYYSEARWVGAPGSANVERTRRKAACVWRSNDVPPNRPAFSARSRGAGRARDAII